MGSLRPTCRPGKLRTREYSLSLGLTNRTIVILTECLTTDTSLAYTSPTGQNLTEHFAPPLYLGLYLKQIQVTMSAEHRCLQYLLITSLVHTSQTPTTPLAEVGLPHPSGTPTSPLQQLQTPAIGLCLSQPASYSTSRTLGSESSHYSDFDCKVLSYAASLNRNETTRNFVSKSRNYTTDYSHLSRNATRDYNTDSFSARYDYYAGDKHGRDGLYPCSSEVLGTWKHFNRSADTLNARNARARSPLVSRELDRYYETKKRCNYVGDLSSGGACYFRYYNYRRVPYFGGSDNYAYMRIRPSGSRRI